MKLDAVKAFNNIYEIPVWNWHMLNESGEMGYLLKLTDYESIPEHSINLGEVYFKLVGQLPHADTSLQELWIKYNVAHLSNVYGGENNLPKVYRYFGDYINKLDSIFNNFRFEDKIYKTAKTLYKHVKKLEGNIIENQFYIFNIQTLDVEPIHTSNLMTELTELSKSVGWMLDPFKTSLGMFYNLRSSAINKSK
jgi:hypothetical protein